MKRLLLLFTMLFAVSLFTTACDGVDEGDVAIADLPQAITTYVTENYPQSTIEEAEKEEEDGAVVYEIELNTGEELIFAADGSFLRLEEDD